MSNADVLTALKQYGVDTNEDKKTEDKKKTPSELIYGPKGVLSDEPSPNLDEKTDSKAIYPNIYGPDIPLVPGKKVQTQDGNGDSNDYNIDLAKAFPRADGPPQPFLTNFSSFQR
jgi:hypothetical protein